MVTAMRVYRYVALDAGLVAQRGWLLAPTAAAAEAQLRARHWRVVRLRPHWLPLARLIRPAEVLLWTQQLGVLLKAGLPLLAALAMLTVGQPRPVFQALLQQVQQRVAQGQTLAQAVSAYPELFDALYVAMLAAGELSGQLDTVLTALAESMSKRQHWRRQLRLALLYPSMVLGLAAALVLGLVGWVVPSFAVLYEGVGVALPAATMWLLATAEWLTDYGWGLGVLPLAAVTAYRRLQHSQGRVRQRLLHWGLGLPWFGRLQQQVVVARWAHTFAMLYAAGVPMLTVLTSVAKVSHHLLYEAATLAARQSVAEGQSLAQALRHSALFPELLLQLVGVGEEAGSLDELMFRAAHHYEAEIDQTVALLSVWLEPLLLLVLGIVVGGVLLALYLPLFNIGDAIV